MDGALGAVGERNADSRQSMVSPRKKLRRYSTFIGLSETKVAHFLHAITFQFPTVSDILARGQAPAAIFLTP